MFNCQWSSQTNKSKANILWQNTCNSFVLKRPAIVPPGLVTKRILVDLQWSTAELGPYHSTISRHLDLIGFTRNSISENNQLLQITSHKPKRRPVLEKNCELLLKSVFLKNPDWKSRYVKGSNNITLLKMLWSFFRGTCSFLYEQVEWGYHKIKEK